MDDLRFDGLARALGRAGSRREGLRAAIGGLFGLGAAGAALDAEAKNRRGKDRDRDRDQAGADGAAAADDGDARRKRRKKTCTPACTGGYTCVKTGTKRKRRFVCQCLSGITCGAACCAEGRTCQEGTCRCGSGVACGAACCAEGETCREGNCTGGPEPVDCHRMGEFCKQTGRPCCDGLTCGSGQGGETDIGCWVPKGGACAGTAECTWGTECRDGVCGPLLCGPANCDGCCTATAHGFCIGGRDQTDAQCGAGGAVCAACPPGKVCVGRRCRCAAGTRPCGDGCIPDAACCTDEVEGCPANEACWVGGNGNGRCECGETGVSCPPSGQACSAPGNAGVCGCGAGSCRRDQVCSGGVCGCGPDAEEVQGACRCTQGFVACGNACIAAGAGGCCENGVVVSPGADCPTTGVCNGATGTCECGESPPLACGQNSFCDISGRCQCEYGHGACGAATPPVCCESFETCFEGRCVNRSLLCGGRLCGAGEGCCGGACTALDNWGTQAVTTFSTPCLQGITCTAAPAGNASRIPFYVYVSPDGLTAWVAEQVNELVSVWTRPNADSLAWTRQTAFGGRCSGACTTTQFKLPYSVVASFDGLTAWVADSENNRISVWRRSTPTGTTWVWQTNFGGGCTAVAACTSDQLWKPGAVAVSTDTLTAWVTDTGTVGSINTPGSNGRVQVWTRPDAASTAWTHKGNIGSYGTAPNQFRRPRGIFVSPDERTMWVADDQNSRVAVWTSSGDPTVAANWSVQTTFGSCTGNPLSGSCQSAGVCNGASQFNRPLGVAASLDGTTAYVSDYCNNRISVWSRSSGTATDWANLTTFGTLAVTPALTGFDEPRGVWVAGDACTAWVADTENQRISIWQAGSGGGGG